MIEPLGLLQAFLIFLAFAAVCVVASFFLAYDPKRHGEPWHDRIMDVVCDCDGMPFDEYQKVRQAADARRDELAQKRAETALARAMDEVERLKAEVARGLQKNGSSEDQKGS